MSLPANPYVVNSLVEETEKDGTDDSFENEIPQLKGTIAFDELKEAVAERGWGIDSDKISKKDIVKVTLTGGRTTQHYVIAFGAKTKRGGSKIVKRIK